MTIYMIADYLTGVFEAIMMFLLFETFCTKKECIPKYVYGISILLLAALVNISNAVFDYGILNAVGMSISFFTMSFLYKGNIVLKAIISVLMFLIIVIAEVIVLFGLTAICNIIVAETINIPTYRLLGIIISKIFTFLIVNIVQIKFKRKDYFVNPSYWFFFLMLFATSIVAVFVIFKLSLSTDDAYMYNLCTLCSFGLLFNTFFALYLYHNLAKQAETIRKQEQYEQSLKMQSKHLGEILITQNQIKSFKHDFQNFIIGLQSYMDSGDYDSANTYIKGLQDMFNPSTSIIETGNIALDAIISTKKAIAESKDIEFDTKIQIPKQMAVDPIDICIIFGNALDNAIEACENISKGHRKISVTVICQNEAVFCRIVNSAPKPKKILFKTTKADKQNHGFGLENIKKSLAKYNSEPTILHGAEEFTLKFVFFIKNS